MSRGAARAAPAVRLARGGLLACALGGCASGGGASTAASGHAGPPLTGGPVTPGLAALVEAERAFARDAAERGTQAAFLAVLDAESVLFRPGPVPGRAWTEAHPAGDVALLWAPQSAALSRAGDLGITTGPWEARGPGSAGDLLAEGSFLTVWRQGHDGWRVLLDHGTQYDAGSKDREGRLESPVVVAQGPAAGGLDEEVVRAAESRRLAGGGTAGGTEPGPGTLRLLAGRPPDPGAPPGEGYAAGPELVEAALAGVVVARSGDLAVCWGTGSVRDAPAPLPETRDAPDAPAARKATFVHVWGWVGGAPHLGIELLDDTLGG